MKGSAWGLGSWILLAASAWPLPARAQDAAAAGALFDRGLADMQAGKYDSGCPALGESYRLDPRPGTLFTLAECQAKWGKIASAVTHYEDYLERVRRMTVDQQVRQREREQVATAQLAALKPQVPQLTLRLATLPAGMKVLRDGSELGAASLNVPLPLDPGDHTITIVGADGERSEQQIHVDRGETKTLDIVVPAIQPAAPPTVPVVAPPVQSAPPPEPPPTPASHRGWTYAAGGVAAVAFATSMVMGSFALAKKSDIDANCVDASCNGMGKQAADTAQAFALASTVAFVASAALGVVTIILAVTEPASAGKRSASITALANGVLLRATW